MVFPRPSPHCSFDCLLGISRLARREFCLPLNMHCTRSHIPNPWCTLLSFLHILLYISSCCVVLSDQPLSKLTTKKILAIIPPGLRGNLKKSWCFCIFLMLKSIYCLRSNFGVPMGGILRNPITCGVLLDKAWPDLHTISLYPRHFSKYLVYHFNQSK